MYDPLTGARLIRRGSGSEMLSFRMSGELAARLRVAAGRDGKSLSEWMRDALHRAAGEARQNTGTGHPATRIGD